MTQKILSAITSETCCSDSLILLHLQTRYKYDVGTTSIPHSSVSLSMWPGWFFYLGQTVNDSILQDISTHRSAGSKTVCIASPQRENDDGE